MTANAPKEKKEDEDLPFKQLELSEMALVSCLAKPSKHISQPRTQSKMKPAKIIKDAVNQDPSGSLGDARHTPRQITGITISDRGDHFVTASDDESFRLYNVREGV